jgi:hypothetical protein
MIMTTNATVQQMEAELHAWEADLDRWRARDEHADGDPQRRREQQQMLDDLHEKRMQARHYLDDLARGANWTELQPEMERLWTDIRSTIAAIKQWA